MNRTFQFLSVALGAAGMMFLAGSAQAQPNNNAPAATTAAQTRPTVAVFNMAAVMRDFGQAKYQVWMLTNRKNEMSKTLVQYRAEYVQIKQLLDTNPNHPEKETKQARLVALIRAIEDEDRRISKDLNDSASAIIGDLYDKMKLVVDKTAEMNGYHIVFAYPDAVTPEETKSTYVKELKLKPPAAQPFYIAPHADITAVVIKTLNSWYPPLDSKGQPVDVSKLPNSPSAPSTSPPQGKPNNGPIPGAGAPRPNPAPGQP